MKINLMSSTYLSTSYPTPPPVHGIVILKTYVYILYIFEFMQGKNWKNLRSTWAQIDRVQNNVQHCVQIALLGKGEGRDRTRTRAETSFQRRLKCKSPLWMCISTIYEYLLIFFLSGSLRSPFLSLCLPVRRLFETAKLLPQVRISFPKMFLLLFYMLNASLLYNFLMTVLLAIFCWSRTEQKKKTHFFACSRRTERERDEKEREDYKNITELWAIFHRI